MKTKKLPTRRIRIKLDGKLVYVDLEQMRTKEGLSEFAFGVRLTELSGIAICSKAIKTKKLFKLVFDNCAGKITLKRILNELKESLTRSYNDDCKPCAHGQNPMACGFKRGIKH